MSFRWLCTLLPLAAAVTLGCGEEEPTAASDDDGLIGTTLVAGLDTAGWRTDAFTLIEAEIEGDTLGMQVGYGGGCRVHKFELLISGEFMESDPVQTVAVLEHDSGDDPCDAYIMTWLFADLSPLRRAWQASYQQQAGEIVLHLEVPASQAKCDNTGFSQPGRCSLLYSF
jgi:hypothetical protein